MNRQEFISDPWALSGVHGAYKNSMLHMRPAPEYASGEVVLASTYRRVGFNQVSESKVPVYGRAFDKFVKSGKQPNKQVSPAGTDREAWRGIVTRTLQSPKQPNQTSKKFLQFTPMVPDLTLYAQSARLSSGSWHAGALVERMIRFGSSDDTDSNDLWSDLFETLSVGPDDDLWARFLQEELESWRDPKLEIEWSLTDLEKTDVAVSAWRRNNANKIHTPASQFVEDLPKLLALKGELTRRQWISMIESLLRLATASHVMWVCKYNVSVFDLLFDAIRGKKIFDESEIKHTLESGMDFWRYGQLAAGTINEMATGFIRARAGINLLLHTLDEKYGKEQYAECLGNNDTIQSLVQSLQSSKLIDKEQFIDDYERVIESDQRLLMGKKGIPSNVKEFLRHVLGKRQTNEPGLDSYDQGFILDKRGSYRAAPWVVSLGPVAVLSITRACTYGTSGMRTVSDLCGHLSSYGINVEPNEVPRLGLGNTLRNLGLVLDSPDAEGGMVLVNPFEDVSQGIAS